MVKIAVDGMGGDYAPGAVVEGLAIALAEFPDYEFVLVGHAAKLEFYLEKYGLARNPRIQIVHAETVCEMAEPSAVSLRSKRDSSITICAKLLKNKEVDAMITPGHTGATVAATKVFARTLPGIDRPALAAVCPGKENRFILIDAGATIECTPINLVQFAIMGGIYAQYLFGVEQPRVGLLSVGGEDVKGNELTKHSFKLLEHCPVNFVGNIEANAAFEGEVEVLVADGFSGNVFLKAIEGFARSIVFWLKRVLTKNALRVFGAILAKNAFQELHDYGDADGVGGAPLLGINGICIIGHGSSSPKAVYNQIRVAGNCVSFGLNEKIIAKINEAHCTTAELEKELHAASSEQP